MRNFDNFREAVESPKSWNSMGYISPQNIFLQLKHYIQRIYLTLLSATVKTHQSPHVIFETISHYSRLYFFRSHITYFWEIYPMKVHIFRLAQLELKFTKFLMSFFEQKVSFSATFDHSLISWEIPLLHFFNWNFICYWQN